MHLKDDIFGETEEKKTERKIYSQIYFDCMANI